MFRVFRFTGVAWCRGSWASECKGVLTCRSGTSSCLVDVPVQVILHSRRSHMRVRNHQVIGIRNSGPRRARRSGLRDSSSTGSMMRLTGRLKRWLAIRLSS